MSESIYFEECDRIILEDLRDKIHYLTLAISELIRVETPSPPASLEVTKEPEKDDKSVNRI